MIIVAALLGEVKYSFYIDAAALLDETMYPFYIDAADLFLAEIGYPFMICAAASLSWDWVSHYVQPLS